MKKKILIISGGISKERLISLDTGQQVANELKKSGYRVKITEPDNNLKKHKHPVSLLGGLIILVNLYFITFLLKIFELDNSIFDNNFIFIIILLSSLFYLIGFIDDLKNLKPNLKLMFLIFINFLIIFITHSLSLELLD